MASSLAAISSFADSWDNENRRMEERIEILSLPIILRKMFW
jgi:hypothetical protein